MTATLAEIGDGAFISMAVILVGTVYLTGVMLTGELRKIRKTLERIADALGRTRESEEG